MVFLMIKHFKAEEYLQQSLSKKDLAEGFEVFTFFSLSLPDYFNLM